MNRWRRYLASLPHGVYSYPECTVKAALMRSIYEEYGRPQLDRDLPSVVIDLVERPPPVSVYVPEVHMRLALAAIQDALDIDDETFVNDALRISRKFLSSPLFRALFFLVSPERVLKHAESRWSAFHRGITIEVTSVKDKRATAIMRAPPKLDSITMARCNVMAIQSALEAAGAKNCKVTCTILSDGVTEMSARWE